MWDIVVREVVTFTTNKDVDTALLEQQGVRVVQSTVLEQQLSEHLDVLLAGPILFIDAAELIIAVHTPELMTKKLADLLHIERAKLATVCDTVSEAICIIDETNRVTGWNHRSETLYGISKQEILGRGIDQFFSNLLLTKAKENRQQVKDTYHKPCPGTHVLINAAPVFLDEAIIGGVCAERDITEVVHLNQELSKASSQVQSLQEEIDKISSQPDPFATICGHSNRIRDAVTMARRIATANVPVLLRGESGTGKELFARALHEASRRSGSFIEVNCGAIPANLFESELFGYQPGSFTGADRKGKQGLFEMADGGTLLLDEIGELPLDMQVKLLRVLQEKKFYRVGGGQPVQVDVRIIAATHCNLEEMIRERRFREDLYYRLNVVSIELPSLRERKEDIPELIYRGLQTFTQQHGKTIESVDPRVMAALLDYTWPGNVRELYNIIERLCILTEGDGISHDHLPPGFYMPSAIPTLEGETENLLVTTTSVERDLIMRVLTEAQNNKAVAAKRLGIPRSTLYYKMNQLGLLVSKN